MADSYAEITSRHESETQRFNDQFDIVTENIGYLLHPSVVAALPENPCIADIATGTGRFLFRVRELYPNATLKGLDISPALFPPKNELLPNLALTVLDIKQPVPEELHGKFDVVHVRMLIAGMLQNGWAPAVKNLTRMLKPGGFLQWEECDFIGLKHLRGGVDFQVKTLPFIRRVFFNALRDSFSYGWIELVGHMQAAGLNPVIKDIASSDRVPETREKSTLNGMQAPFKWARLMTERGAPNAMTSQEIDLLEKEALEEVFSDTYIIYDIYVICGRKPL
ncbi:S-adenosyl-L-methionine-dependent methyltransferase [Daldinia decipiens]|uniref:S-adenosyl-L-methionine-dependent methyltransferase n=1 Tax=Daldinia decipiens TaxID=326647 RepID=UPI0020C399AB|nr:S-adenosyl-L-methionine-dependent methyltransferase [Daldinia decipiens]KAI1655852.1 S-adenosyl-L-methionine-dependent methyltransferase [Daldinia decipiens]